MADVGVDTSSYPKPQAQPGFFDTVNKLQGVQQQGINIDQSKLKLMNDRYLILNKELSTLMGDPDLTPDKIIGASQNLVKLGLIPPDIHAKFVSQIPNNQQVQQNPGILKQYIMQTADRARDVNSAVNFHYGVTSQQGDQQNTIVGRTSPKFGFIPQTTIQQQNPPNLPVATPGGTQYLGPQNQPPVVNQVQPDQNSLPVQQPQANTTPIRPNVVKTVPGQVVQAPQAPQQQQSQAPTGPMASQPPLFEEGKKMYAEDQNLATQKLTAIQPALQALPLIKQLPFAGPGTEQITKIAATLKNLGIIPTSTNNDKTAITQEVIKKMNNYIANSPIAGRSDAAQYLAQNSNPSPTAQIQPALLKLTQDAIAADRVEAARAGAFSDEKGNARSDLQNYGNHRSTFPAKMDQRVFKLDTMEPEERNVLLDKMKKDYNKKGGPTFEAKKFKESLDIADKQGLINTSGQ